MRVDVAVGEGDHAAALLGVGGTEDPKVLAEALGQRVERVRGEVHLVLSDRLHSRGLQVADRGSQAHGLCDGRGASLELPGQHVCAESVVADVTDHPATAEEGGHLL